MLKQMLQNSEGDERHKRLEQHKLDAMLSLCEETRCRRQTLLAYFDEDMPEPCGCKRANLPDQIGLRYSRMSRPSPVVVCRACDA